MRRGSSSWCNSDQLLSTHFCPATLVVLGRPSPGLFWLGLSLSGAYLAEKYPGPAWLAALSARNVGNTWPVERSGSFSIATTLPIFGAMLPSAAAGFRPICTQVWD